VFLYVRKCIPHDSRTPPDCASNRESYSVFVIPSEVEESIASERALALAHAEF
jgi:hypothetical protein